MITALLVVGYLLLLWVVVSSASRVIRALGHLAHTVTMLSRNVDAARNETHAIPQKIIEAHVRSLTEELQRRQAVGR